MKIVSERIQDMRCNRQSVQIQLECPAPGCYPSSSDFDERDINCMLIHESGLKNEVKQSTVENVAIQTATCKVVRFIQLYYCHSL